MGLDFIKKARRGFAKRWGRERARLSAADLFRCELGHIRTIAVRPHDLSHFSEGGRYVLHVEGARIVIYHNRLEVGVCEQPPPSVLGEIVELGGKALGVFFRRRERSGLVDVAVCLLSTEKEAA